MDCGGAERHVALPHPLPLYWGRCQHGAGGGREGGADGGREGGAAL